MSKSHRQLQHKKSLSTTLYLDYQRTHSKNLSKYSDIPLHIIAERGKKHYQHNQLADALKYLEEVINSNNKNVGQFISEAWYLAAVIKMSKHQYKQALNYLTEVYSRTGNYKQNTVFLLAICHNSLGSQQKSLQYLNVICTSNIRIINTTNQSIQQQSPRQSQYSLKDAYFYRAKVLHKLQSYEQSLISIQKAIELGNKANTVRILYCQILIKIGKHNQAKQYIDNIIEQFNHSNQIQTDPINSKQLKRIYNLKISVCLETRQFQIVSEYLDKSLAIDENDSETLYLKSRVHRNHGQSDQMILALNQCLNANNHKKSATMALQDLIAVSMDEKDFYQAFQYAKRMSFLRIDSLKLQGLAKLAQGTTFLMKKKYGEALLLFGSINPGIYCLKINNLNKSVLKQTPSKQKQLQINMQNLYYDAMGYAYFCLGEYDNAYKTYKKIQKSADDKNHKSHYYNIALCQGIKAYEQDKIQEAIKLFENATDYLIRAQPYFYIAVILTTKNLPQNPDSDFFMKIIDILDSGLKINQNSQIFYYRSLVYFYLGMNAQAIEDIDKAIQKSEDNIAKYFYLRALIFFQQKSYEQAIAQLTTCISIDENFYDAYLQRAKIKLITNQADEAYEDLSFHPLCDDWRPLFLLYQGNYRQIIAENKNTSIDDNILENANFMLGNFNAAGPAGKIVLALVCENYVEVDKVLEDAIQIGFPVGCLDIQDLFMFKSFCLYKLGKLEQAIEKLKKTQNILRQTGSISYCQQQQKKLLAIKVNTIMLSIKMCKKDQALQLCDALISDVYEGSIYDELVKVKQLINGLSNKSSGKADQSNKQNAIAFFESEQMLNHCFQSEKFEGMVFNFLIPYPRIKILDIQIVPYEQPLMSFSMKDIDNRPEAPWMRRDQYGVIFTNRIHQFDDLNLVTQNNENQPSETASHIQQNQKLKIKQGLQLDPEVLKKLQKLSVLKQ